MLTFNIKNDCIQTFIDSKTFSYLLFLFMKGSEQNLVGDKKVFFLFSLFQSVSND